MRSDINQRAFLALVKAGLWEQECRLEPYKEVDLNKVYQLAHEQSVIGLVAAGIEHVSDVRIPQKVKLSFVGAALQIEQRNIAMNDFVAKLIERLRYKDIYALLVKGQGVAQCYERPLWRSCGDVDFLLDVTNYEKAKRFLIPLAASLDDEDKRKMHFGMTILETSLRPNGGKRAKLVRGTSDQGRADLWVVELHGRMPFAMSEKVERVIDEVIENANTDHIQLSGVLKGVAVPKADEHLFIVFTHFLHHFFLEGVGLRQICDWCRMLWVHRESLDYCLLESRIKKAGLLTEWKVFATLAVEYLGMPVEAMPLYEKGNERKASRVLHHVIKSGNFGHNNNVSYRGKYTGGLANVITFFRRMRDFMKFTVIFPMDSPKFFVTYVRGKR